MDRQHRKQTQKRWASSFTATNTNHRKRLRYQGSHKGRKDCRAKGLSQKSFRRHPSASKEWRRANQVAEGKAKDWAKIGKFQRASSTVRGRSRPDRDDTSQWRRNCQIFRFERLLVKVSFYEKTLAPMRVCFLFVAMSSDAASLNTVTEEFGFNAEFVISAALTVQAHYSPIIEKPPKDDLPDVKPAVGKESPTDPISPPPAVKEDRKPIPNSETACEGRTDKVACELVENHVQKCTWNPTTSACMDKDAENEKQVGKKTVQQPEPKNAGLSDDQKTDPKNAGLSDKKKTDPKNAGLSDDKKTDSKNAGLSDKKKTDPINAGLSDKKKTDPKNAGLSDDQTPVRKKLVRKNAGLSVKKTSFMSNRDAKVDAVALAQRSELRQCLQEKTERRLEAQEGVRKVLDGSVEELDAFMQLDPVIVAKEDMMLPNGSSTLHVMVKRNVWQKQSEIKEHGAVEKTYERSYSLSTIKKLRTKLEKVLKILDKDRSRNPGKWDIGIDNLEVHFESWNRLGWQLPAVPGILGVDPVVSVELDFDLSALVKSVVDLKRGAENVARKDKCRECIARGQGFCDTRYEIDDWDPVKEDVCVDLEDGVERAEAECARRTNSCSGDDGKAKCFLTHYQDCKNIQFRLLDQNRLPDRSYGYKKWS